VFGALLVIGHLRSAALRHIMKTIIAIASLLGAAYCHGADSFGLPLFDAAPALVESPSPNWHPPLLPPELLPTLATNQAPAVPASSHPFEPPATILAVSRASDKCSLMIRYELAGKTNEQRIILTNGIADFHFCSWVRDRGIALALSDPEGEVYWAAFYFAGRKGPVYPRRLRSPPGYSLLGIVNNRGDSIIISAVERSSERGEASGWMYFNGCPPAGDSFSRIPTNQIQVGGFEHLVMFNTTPRSGK